MTNPWTPFFSNGLSINEGLLKIDASHYSIKTICHMRRTCDIFLKLFKSARYFLSDNRPLHYIVEGTHGSGCCDRRTPRLGPIHGDGWRRRIYSKHHINCVFTVRRTHWWSKTVGLLSRRRFFWDECLVLHLLA